MFIFIRFYLLFASQRFVFFFFLLSTAFSRVLSLSSMMLTMKRTHSTKYMNKFSNLSWIIYHGTSCLTQHTSVKMIEQTQFTHSNVEWKIAYKLHRFWSVNIPKWTHRNRNSMWFYRKCDIKMCLQFLLFCERNI